MKNKRPTPQPKIWFADKLEMLVFISCLTASLLLVITTMIKL